MNITYNNKLTAKDFCSLRKSVNFHDIPEKYAQRALDKSDYIIVAEVDNIPIGMARFISDGTQVYIMDVIVHPNYQGNGIGKGLMDRIIKYIDSTEYNQMLVNLQTNTTKVGFYEKFGFKQTIGMHLWMEHVPYET